ncbi:uncharacterized protein LOC114840878 isoform X2 [Esox lucius]|uniref:uncharacterized protein LOC114840878 isoform X2 n=1 Tax=Esox lucius TaxID=8010 RepID=UPI001477135E|nr:uncharacterized protein LOC114840878 isoform X2 [Esox lucius]
MDCNEELLEIGAPWPTVKSMPNTGIVFFLQYAFFYFTGLLSGLKDCLFTLPVGLQWQPCACNGVQWELIMAVASVLALMRIVQTKSRRYLLTEKDMADRISQLFEEKCNTLEELSDMKRLLGECETRAEMQLANLQSSQQECQELKMRLKNTENDRGAVKEHYSGDAIDTSVTNTKPTNVKNEEKIKQGNKRWNAVLIRSKRLKEKNSVLNCKLQEANQTYEQTLTKLSEDLEKMEEHLQSQQLKTCAAEHALAVEKQEGKILRQMIFELTNPDKDISWNKKPYVAQTSPVNTFKAVPSQDLFGRPTKTMNASNHKQDLTEVLAKATDLTSSANKTPATMTNEKTTLKNEKSTGQDPGSQCFSKPATHQDRRRRYCFPFRKWFRVSKFFPQSSSKDPVVNVCPPGTPEALHLVVDSP